MARPSLIDTLPIRERILAANMYHRNESWETIFKYISLDDTLTAQAAIRELADTYDPMSEALYLAHMDLAQTEHIMEIAAAKSEEGSPNHMSQYQKLAGHRIRIVNQIDDLVAKEAARGNTYEPVFDVESPEYRVVRAAILAFLTQDQPENDDFDELSPEDQARFFQILAEGA